MFAALKMIEKFAPYLCLRKFKLRVDCSALSWLKTYAIQENSMAARWIARLEGFYFTVEQRAREKHMNADGLSKRTQDLELKGEEIDKEKVIHFSFMSKEQQEGLAPLVVNDDVEVTQGETGDHAEKEALTLKVMSSAKQTAYLPFLSVQQQMDIAPIAPWKGPITMLACKICRMVPRYDVEFLREKQFDDRGIQTMKELLMRDGDSERILDEVKFANLNLATKRWFKKNKERLFVNESKILCLKGEADTDPFKIVIPDFFKTEILHETHELLGHGGVTKTADKVERHYVWPALRCDAYRHVTSCLTCQQAKAPQKKLRTELKVVDPSRVNELVMIDFEQLSTSHEGYKGVLMMVDHYSKYTLAYPMMKFTALGAAKAIWELWALVCGIPEIIHSDNGSQFESELFKEVLMHMGCVKTHTSGYHPQGNGLAERQNRTIVQALRTACGEDQKTWAKHLTKVLIAYNSSKNATTGYTPYRLMYGREANLPPSMMFPNYAEAGPKATQEYVKEQMEKMALVTSDRRRQSQQNHVRMKRNYDKRRSYHPVLKVGQWAVIFMDAVRKKGHVKKLTRRWRGPYKILKVYGEGLLYQFENGYKAHYERVRLYIPRMRDLKLNEEGDFNWNWDTAGKPYIEIEPVDSEIEGGPDWSPGELEGSEKDLMKAPARKDMRLRPRRGEEEPQEPHQSLASDFESGEEKKSTGPKKGAAKSMTTESASETTNENYISPEGEPDSAAESSSGDEEKLRDRIQSGDAHSDSGEEVAPRKRVRRTRSQIREVRHIMDHWRWEQGIHDSYSDCEKWAENALAGDEEHGQNLLYDPDPYSKATTSMDGRLEQMAAYYLNGGPDSINTEEELERSKKKRKKMKKGWLIRMMLQRFGYKNDHIPTEEPDKDPPEVTTQMTRENPKKKDTKQEERKSKGSTETQSTVAASSNHSPAWRPAGGKRMPEMTRTGPAANTRLRARGRDANIEEGEEGTGVPEEADRDEEPVSNEEMGQQMRTILEDQTTRVLGSEIPAENFENIAEEAPTGSPEAPAAPEIVTLESSVESVPNDETCKTEEEPGSRDTTAETVVFLDTSQEMELSRTTPVVKEEEQAAQEQQPLDLTTNEDRQEEERTMEENPTPPVTSTPAPQRNTEGIRDIEESPIVQTQEVTREPVAEGSEATTVESEDSFLSATDSPQQRVHDAIEGVEVSTCAEETEEITTGTRTTTSEIVETTPLTTEVEITQAPPRETAATSRAGTTGGRRSQGSNTTTSRKTQSGPSTASSNTKPKKRKSEAASLAEHMEGIGKVPSHEGFDKTATRGMVNTNTTRTTSRTGSSTSGSHRSTQGSGRVSINKTPTTVLRRNSGVNMINQGPTLKLWIACEDPTKNDSGEEEQEEEEQAREFPTCTRAIEEMAEERIEARIGRISMTIHPMGAGGQHMFFEAPINVHFDRHGIRRFLLRAVDGLDARFLRMKPKLGHVARVPIGSAVGVHQLWFIYTRNKEADDPDLFLFENGITVVIRRAQELGIRHLATVRPPWHPVATKNWVRATQWLDRQFQGTGIDVSMYQC